MMIAPLGVFALIADTINKVSDGDLGNWLPCWGLWACIVSPWCWDWPCIHWASIR